MADRVPTSGPFQSDPELLRLLSAYNAAVAPGTGIPGHHAASATAGDALKRYVNANRIRLGIPDNYTVQTKSNGEVGLYDPNNNQFKWIGIGALVMGTAGAAGLAVGAGAPAAATGGVAAPASASGAAEGVAGVEGAIDSGLPLSADLSGAAAGGLPAFGSDPNMIGGTTLGNAGSLVGKNAPGLLNKLTTPQNIAALIAAVPALKTILGDGSNGNAFGPDSPMMKSAQDSLDMANARTKEAGPIYDALVNQAYGQTPTRYRGAAPPTYPAGGDAAPAGAYQFNAPQFGGR